MNYVSLSKIKEGVYINTLSGIEWIAHDLGILEHEAAEILFENKIQSLQGYSTKEKEIKMIASRCGICQEIENEFSRFITTKIKASMSGEISRTSFLYLYWLAEDWAEYLAKSFDATALINPKKSPELIDSTTSRRFHISEVFPRQEKTKRTWELRTEPEDARPNSTNNLKDYSELLPLSEISTKKLALSVSKNEDEDLLNTLFQWRGKSKGFKAFTNFLAERTDLLDAKKSDPKVILKTIQIELDEYLDNYTARMGGSPKKERRDPSRMAVNLVTLLFND